MESGKRQFVTPGHLPDEGSNTGRKGPAYQEDTSRCIFNHVFQTRSPGASNADEMEKIASPFFRRRGSVRWACLAIFFLDLVLGEVFVGTPETCLRREQA